MQVLVVYGSTRGATAGLAHMVADACATHGVATSVRRAVDVRSISGVDAVVVGGAIYGNRWHPEATAFVRRHHTALRELPVWFFSSGPLDDSARSGALAALPQVSSLAREIDIRGHMTFGGMLDRRPTGLLAMSPWRTLGDFRDRDHVAEWVDRIAAELAAGASSESEGAGSRHTGKSKPRPKKPKVVIKPFAPEPPRPAYDEIVIASEPSGEARRMSRLRRYLTLDPARDDDDEGLDLFTELTDSEPLDDPV
ncbi:MAG TPA: flavodoxin domain-containing protein [Mycobacteriales bacterium]|nr:flavodoxin domain-containing protein [Mycobacteriales bacterium]